MSIHTTGYDSNTGSSLSASTVITPRISLVVAASRWWCWWRCRCHCRPWQRPRCCSCLTSAVCRCCCCWRGWGCSSSWHRACCRCCCRCCPRPGSSGCWRGCQGSGGLLPLSGCWWCRVVVPGVMQYSWRSSTRTVALVTGTLSTAKRGGS